MTDQQIHSHTTSDTRRNVNALTITTGIAWAVAVVMTVLAYVNYQDRWDDTTSAPQVSQIADEFMVTVIFWFVLAAAVTAVCVVVALTTRRSDALAPA